MYLSGIMRCIAATIIKGCAMFPSDYQSNNRLIFLLVLI